MPAALAPLLDVVITFVFAAIGRRNHGEGDAVLGVLATAWPFVVGALVGWVLVALRRRSVADGLSVLGGVPVWLSTVAVGMVLRHLSGRGVAVSFIIVTLTFNGLLMLGWRTVLAWRRRRALRA